MDMHAGTGAAGKRFRHEAGHHAVAHGQRPDEALQHDDVVGGTQRAAMAQRQFELALGVFRDHGFDGQALCFGATIDGVDEGLQPVELGDAIDLDTVGPFTGKRQAQRLEIAVGGPFAEIRGEETIRTFLSSLVGDAEVELLTAQPQDSRGVKQLGADAGARDLAALKRGVKMRTLYQHAARRGVDTRRYVAAVTAAGAEVRTLDEFFNRLIVVDRRIAIIPSHEGVSAAMVISEPSMVTYLVDMFERHWERARPFTSSETSVMRDIAAEQRAMTIRMLLEGRADPAGAKRLGVSPRTYAGYVADLKNEFEVETRFQLGYEMGKRGISGRETDEPLEA